MIREPLSLCATRSLCVVRFFAVRSTPLRGIMHLFEGLSEHEELGLEQELANVQQYRKTKENRTWS